MASSMRFKKFILTIIFGLILYTVIDNYQYRVDDPKAKLRNPDIKDIIKLNKNVLKEGATTSAVSRIISTNSITRKMLTVSFFILIG